MLKAPSLMLYTGTRLISTPASCVGQLSPTEGPAGVIYYSTPVSPLFQGPLKTRRGGEGRRKSQGSRSEAREKNKAVALWLCGTVHFTPHPLPDTDSVAPALPLAAFNDRDVEREQRPCARKSLFRRSHPRCNALGNEVNPFPTVRFSLFSGVSNCKVRFPETRKRSNMLEHDGGSFAPSRLIPFLSSPWTVEFPGVMKFHWESRRHL